MFTLAIVVSNPINFVVTLMFTIHIIVLLWKSHWHPTEHPLWNSNTHWSSILIFFFTSVAIVVSNIINSFLHIHTRPNTWIVVSYHISITSIGSFVNHFFFSSLTSNYWDYSMQLISLSHCKSIIIRGPRGTIPSDLLILYRTCVFKKTLIFT